MYEPSYVHYEHVIASVKPGDLIEILGYPYSHWALYIKEDDEGRHWCYHVAVEKLDEVQSVNSSKITDPNILYGLHRDQFRNCAPCAWETARTAKTWSRLARPSLVHKCCYQEADGGSNGQNRLAFVKHVQLVDLLEEKKITNSRFADGLSVARINNQTILAEKFGLSCRGVDVILNEISSLLDKQVPYNVVTLNCEHYVTSWKYGASWSNNGANLWQNVGLDYGSLAILRGLNGVATSLEKVTLLVGMLPARLQENNSVDSERSNDSNVECEMVNQKFKNV